MYGDPDHLDEIARSLSARAEQIDARAAELVTRATAAQWQSTAAAAMRRHAAGTAEQFRRSSGAYRDAAESVRDLARSLRRKLAWIEAIERAVVRLVDEARNRLVALGHTVVDAAGDVVDLVGEGLSEVGSWIGIGDGPEPDPADVALCQQAWPPPGHKDWLEHAALAGVA